MASFTDTPTKFNPYIAQTPVEQYAYVEQAKQQQYNQGIQAIESIRESVAGLPVDSKYSPYVQSALSKLNEGIKKVAGSDFSNTQLISQIQGAGKQIASDPIVRYGVMSAVNDKENRDQMHEDRKNGKLTPDNEFDYLDEYNKWKQNPDLATPFNYTYSTFVDVNKKWMEALKAINPTANVQDIPFETDASGNIDYSKVSAAMTEKGYKGISPETIETAIRSTLSEADMNQLRISAKYRFRGYGPEDLVKVSDQKYADKKVELSKAKEQIQEQIKLYPETTTLGKKLKDSLDYINKQIGDGTNGGQLDVQRKNEQIWIRQNPDRAKTEMYKEGYISQFSHAFSYMEESTKYIDNPITKQQNWLADYQMNAAKFEYQKRHDSDQMDIDRARLQIERDKANKEKGTVGEFTTDLGINTDLGKTATQSIADVGTQAFAQADQLKASLIDKIAKPGEDRNQTLARVNTMITQYQSGTLDEAYANIKPQIASIIKAQATGANVSQYMQDVDKQVSSQLQNSPEYQALQANLASRHILKLGNYVFTPQEVLNFKNKEKDSGGQPGGSGGVSFTRTQDYSQLTEKEKILAHYLGSTRYGSPATFKEGNEDQKRANKYIDDFGEIQNQSAEVMKRKNQLMEDFFKTRSPQFVPQASTIEMAKPETQRAVFQNISTIVNSRIKGDKGGNEGLDIEKVNEMISDSKNNKMSNTRVDFISQPGNYQLVLYNEGDKQVVHLTNQEAAQFNPKLANMNTDLATRLAIGGLSTNYLGTPEGAYMQRTDFPSVKKLNVTADLKPIEGQSDASGNPLFYIEYSTQLNGKWVKYQLPNPVTADQARINAQMVTDDMILAAYKQAGLTN